ncbi:class I SAM-dependent methyltransferase [Paeniglutamicibacter terrestris]|uniref:Class I SAM-dependent methyltransferase n=1 Tax=Paeniglutamicibacter terrestris TaxID=2723403 RepID=A0ABX1G277_9MICC|nr:class I SAM-dependent methyltransferase [Paeniglutamicibacter terrestris]NKG20335.1 class I SAM-dependent methyltransferase [Paeniglutamicibacter terrestris]
MSDTEESIKRYTSGDLRERLHEALRAAGREPAVLLPGDLGEADHFHSGGLASTTEVARALGIGLGTRVLDVGSGIGGPARLFAQRGAVVTGVDVTHEFVILARELNLASGLGGSITMLEASGADTGLPASSFDAATLLHVGMNLADKQAVFNEVYRLLRPGGVFGVFDLMGTNQLAFPMPWADAAASSHVESDASYRKYLHTAGFSVSSDTSMSQAVRQQMAAAQSAQRANPTPLGSPILLGTDPMHRIANVLGAIEAGELDPRLIHAVR